jgi:hypothetical protein
MSVQTRVVIIRLRTGAALLLAPANVFPWPHMLERKTRAMHARGVRQALPDAQAMRTLRLEYAQLLHAGPSRGPPPATSRDIVVALERAAEAGLLTIISGNPGVDSVQDRVDNLTDLVSGRGLIGGEANRHDLTPGGGLPSATDRIPDEVPERIDWILRRSMGHLSPDVRQALDDFFTPRNIRTTIALLVSWRAGSSRGGGFMVDANLFALGVWLLGSGAVLAFGDIKSCFDQVVSATSWTELDIAARALAAAMTRFKATLFRQILWRVGTKSGGAGGKEVQVNPPPSVLLKSRDN